MNNKISIIIYGLFLSILSSCSTDNSLIDEGAAIIEGGVLCEYQKILYLSKDDGHDTSVFILENEYSIAEREVEYSCIFSPKSRVVFSTTNRGLNFVVDIEKKTIEVDERVFKADNLIEGKNITITIGKNYQLQTIRINTDEKITEVSFLNDGNGGAGGGIVNESENVYEMPHGYYKIQLLSGDVKINSIRVTTPNKKIFLLLYGDSITETEAYYPTNLFQKSWTQLLNRSISENVCTSGASGCGAENVLNAMKSELPYLDVKYVMVTIGTNGGNTIENLSEIVEFALSLGITPILNHIPCDESGTQIDANKIIDIVRAKYDIVGADLDLATSIKGDGIEVDKTTMFWEDYKPYTKFNHDYWHHPNVEGSRRMFLQIKSDLPWLFP